MGRNEDAAFSRSGASLVDGKCEARIDIHVPVAIEEELIALSVLAGKPRGEYARMLLVKAIKGELAWLRSIGALPEPDERRNGGGR